MTKKPGGIAVREIRNPVLTYPCVGFEVEKAKNRKLVRLRETYQLDRVIDFRGSEFEKIMAVRHWIRSKIDTTATPTPCAFDALSILASADDGGKFYCSHFALVTTQVLTALGWIARDVAIDHDPGKAEGSRHHGISEVWCNEMARWIAIDAMFDSHVEKDGHPLSVLDIRDGWLENRGADLRILTGPEKRKVAFTRGGTRTRRHESSAYFWYCYTTRSNLFAKPMDWNPASHRYLLFLDKHNLGKAWRQGKSPGRVHGYYEKGLFVGSTRREDFNWNVNCVRMSVSSGRNTTVRLATNTPNLDHLEMQRDGKRWQRCGSTVNLRIPSAGLCLSARSVNRFGLAGPASNIVLCAAESGPTQ